MMRLDCVFARERWCCACFAWLMLVAVAAPVAAADAPQTDRASGPAVSVVPVTRSNFTETILVTGSLVAEREVLVSPQIEGYRISEILVEEGDRVADGQVLARLSDDTLKAQLAQLEANRVRADASIAQAKSRIIEAEANKKQADAAFARAEDLIRSGSTSRSTYDEREAAARTSAAAVTQAQDGLRVAEADKVQIEAQIHESQLRLGYTDIKAPEGGIISRRTARVGALASAAAEPLFRIIAKGQIELDAEVPEIYLPRLSIGQAARIEAAGLKPRTGTVRLISPEVDRTTRLGKVRIHIGQDDQLRIGSFARATIDTASKEALGLPATAVLNRDSGPTVQVVKDGRVETRKVVTGMRTGGKVEIVDGVADGEQVVLRSGTLLRDGDAVRPMIAGETSLNEAK
jgi:HlyD family secretion protein